MKVIIVMLSTFTCLGCFSTTDVRNNYNKDLETPTYEVLKTEQNFELRQYPSFLVASVQVSGDFDEASRQGFGILASYIFGDNSAQTKIAMTSPVSVKSDIQSEKIAMTTPVTVSESSSNQWTISFSMPSKYTLKSLPTPKNKKIQVSMQKPQKVAVSIFSGFTSKKALNKQETNLRTWIKAQGLEADQMVNIARYNDPFTLPWNRRNEVLVQVKS